MSLDIFISRQARGINPARETIINNIINCYKNTKFNKRRKIFVIVPKQDTYQVERELIDRVGEGGLFGLQITDLNTFILKMIEEDRSKTQIVDQHGRLMLVQKALLDVEDQLSIYKGSIREPNFKNAILTQLSELKQAQITPEVIKESLEQIPSSLLKDKLRDLCLILEAFNQNLGSDHYDEDDLIALAIASIPDSGFLKDSKLFLLDENTYDYQSILFLTLASKKVSTLEIALNTDQNPTVTDMSAFVLTNQILNTFRKLAQDYQVSLEVTNLNLPQSSHSLDFLATELFSYSPKKYNGKKKNIHLFRGRDPWDEVKQVAQLILKENNHNIPFSSIAVVSNNPSEYDPIIRRVFSQYGVPYFIDENHQVIDNHFIQSVLSALDTINSHFARTEILNYIKSDFSGLTSEQSDLLENYIIEAGIRPYEWKKPFKRLPEAWRSEKTELTPEDEIVQIQSIINKRLKPFSPATKKNHKTKDYIKFIRQYLDQTKSQEVLEETSENLSGIGEQELSSRYRQIWNILLEILDQMENALGEEELSFSDFISILKSGIASYEIGVIPEDDEAVIISSVERTRLPEVKNIYFLGLNEELVPKKQGEEMLLTDYDKEVLIKQFNINHQVLKDKQFQYELEENNILNLLTKATDNITFTYHSYTGSGEQAFPSRYVDVLKRIYGNDIVQKPTKFFELLTPQRANVILENFLNDTDYLKLKRILEEWFSENNTSDVVNKVQTQTLKPVDILENIDAKDLYQIKDRANKVSISRLENYASCPFKHFIDYGLRLHEREEYEVRFLDTGIVIHQIFHIFLSDILNESDYKPEDFKEKAQTYLNNPELFDKKYDEVFNQALQDLKEIKRYEHSAASRFLISKVKRTCKLALRIILQQLCDSGFMPVELENYFNDHQENGIVLEGRIDRVDIRDSGDKKQIRVVDYKTNNKDIEYIDVLYGGALQLAVYLQEVLKKNESDYLPKGAFYFGTNQSFNDRADLETQIEKKFKLNGINYEDGTKIADIDSKNSAYSPGNLTKEELQQILDYSSNLVQTFSNELSSGNISINPVFKNGKETSCKYCSYRSVCRFNANESEFNLKNLPEHIDKERFFNHLNNQGEASE